MPDNQRVKITLTGVTGPVDSTNATASVGFLIGDVNNSHSVNASDISAIKARIGQTLGPNNFQFDLSTSGTINASDMSMVKARSGLRLP